MIGESEEYSEELSSCEIYGHRYDEGTCVECAEEERKPLMNYRRILWQDGSVFGEKEDGEIELVAVCPDRRRTIRVVNALRVSGSGEKLPAREMSAGNPIRHTLRPGER